MEPEPAIVIRAPRNAERAAFERSRETPIGQLLAVLAAAVPLDSAVLEIPDEPGEALDADERDVSEASRSSSGQQAQLNELVTQTYPLDDFPAVTWTWRPTGWLGKS